MTLNKQTPYFLADWYGKGIPRDVRAIWTGEKRPPKKGEWYLSGGIIEAYLSPGLDMALPIAKLVHTSTKTVITITGDYLR